MRALWSDRQNCSHHVSQKVKRIRRLSDESMFGRDSPRTSGDPDKRTSSVKNFGQSLKRAWKTSIWALGHP